MATPRIFQNKDAFHHAAIAITIILVLALLLTIIVSTFNLDEIAKEYHYDKLEEMGLYKRNETESANASEDALNTPTNSSLVNQTNT